MSLAPLLRAALADGAFGALGAAYLHRAVAEDSLGVTVGRDALVADAIARAALLGDPGCEVLHDGPLMAVTRQTGAHAAPLWGVAPTGAPLALREHRWSHREGAGVLDEFMVADWVSLADAIGADLEQVAAALGAAQPMQPPLGELRSGEGQFLTGETAGWDGPRADLVDALHRIWTGRRLDGIAAHYAADAAWTGPRGRAGGPPALRRWLTGLLATLPDATLVPDAVEDGGDRVAIRWRLFGHSGGRRARLIVSMLLTLRDGRIVADDTLLDELALLATPHRPLLAL